MPRKSSRIQNAVLKTQAVQNSDNDSVTNPPRSQKSQEVKSSVMPAKKAQASKRKAVEDAVNDVDKGHIEKPPQKRKKGQQLKNGAPVKKVRGRQGALKQLVEMPLDILFEILLCLEPLDLVQLTRTSTALRKILMNSSALFIWKEARGNMEGIPECPDDMSEAAYASLMFENHCHMCQTRHSVKHCWELQARWCVKCIKQDDRFISSEGFLKEHYGYDFYHASPRVVLEVGSSVWAREWDIWYEPWLVKRVEEYNKLDEDGQMAWRINSCDKREIYNEFGEICEAWLNERKEKLKGARDDVRSRRIEEIKVRLISLGYGDEVSRISEKKEFLNHPLVRPKKELTERIWQNIEPRLIEFMEDERKRYNVKWTGKNITYEDDEED